MATLLRRQYQIYIERPPEAVFGFITDLKNHARLCPEEQKEDVAGGLNAAMAVGAIVLFRSGPWGDITAEVIEHEAPRLFTLRQVEGPFLSWQHRYKLAAFQEGTLLSEQYEYAHKGLGAAKEKLSGGKLWDDWVRYRQNEMKKILERIGRIKGPGV